MAAQKFKTGMNCNLGVGTPTMAAGFAASTGTHAFLQSENGMTDWKTYPEKNQEDSDRISVGRETVAALPGASSLRSDESFGQIRGGQWDLIVLGALERSQYSGIAKFMILVKGMGRGVDLVSNPEKSKVLVVQTHIEKYGKSKIRKK